MKPTAMRLVSCAAAVCVMTLQACATLNKNECALADWREIGFSDGRAAKGRGRIAQHRKACAKHGMTVDRTAYMAGYAQGLEIFCQPQNGFSLGARGRSYAGDCPNALESAFLDAYNAGRELHQLKRAVRDAERNILSARRQLEDAKKKQKKLREESSDRQLLLLEAKLIGEGTSTGRRAELLKEIRKFEGKRAEIDQLDPAIGAIEDELAELEREKAAREGRLERYRASLSSEYRLTD